MNNPIICVDFDGVIHSYKSGWKGVDVIPDPPVDGAIDWLLLHLPVPDAVGMAPPYIGPEVQIYSSRSKEIKGISAMRQWLMKHGVPQAYFSDNVLKFPTQKPAAFLTIDDRAICFEGRFPTSEEMMRFVPWNKRIAGATGEFPDGKKSKDDEGELQFIIGHDKREVVVNFGKPIKWFSLPPEQAIALGRLMIRHAEEITQP